MVTFVQADLTVDGCGGPSKTIGPGDVTGNDETISLENIQRCNLTIRDIDVRTILFHTNPQDQSNITIENVNCNLAGISGLTNCINFAKVGANMGQLTIRNIYYEITSTGTLMRGVRFAEPIIDVNDTVRFENISFALTRSASSAVTVIGVSFASPKSLQNINDFVVDGVTLRDSSIEASSGAVTLTAMRIHDIVNCDSISISNVFILDTVIKSSQAINIYALSLVATTKIEGGLSSSSTLAISNIAIKNVKFENNAGATGNLFALYYTAASTLRVETISLRNVSLDRVDFGSAWNQFDAIAAVALGDASGDDTLNAGTYPSIQASSFRIKDVELLNIAAEVTGSGSQDNEFYAVLVRAKILGFHAFEISNSVARNISVTKTAGSRYISFDNVQFGQPVNGSNAAGSNLQMSDVVNDAVIVKCDSCSAASHAILVHAVHDFNSISISNLSFTSSSVFSKNAYGTIDLFRYYAILQGAFNPNSNDQNLGNNTLEFFEFDLRDSNVTADSSTITHRAVISGIHYNHIGDSNSIHRFHVITLNNVSFHNNRVVALASARAFVTPCAVWAVKSFIDDTTLSSESITTSRIAIDNISITNTHLAAEASGSNERRGLHGVWFIDSLISYEQITISNIYIEDESTSFGGSDPPKLIVGVNLYTGKSIDAGQAARITSSFVISHIHVPSPISLTSPHASYSTAISSNVFSNLNNYKTVTIDDVGYLFSSLSLSSNLLDGVILNLLNSDVGSLTLSTQVHDSDFTARNMTLSFIDIDTGSDNSTFAIEDIVCNDTSVAVACVNFKNTAITSSRNITLRNISRDNINGQAITTLSTVTVVRFKGPVEGSSEAGLRVSDLTLSNVRSTTGPNIITAISFAAAVTNFKFVEVKNLRIADVYTSSSSVSISSFLTTTSSELSGTDAAGSFASFENLTIEHCDLTATGGALQTRPFALSGAFEGFEKALFNRAVLNNITAVLTWQDTQMHAAIFFGAAMSGTSSVDSSLVIENTRIENIRVTSPSTNLNLLGVSLEGTTDQYTKIEMRNTTLRNITVDQTAGSGACSFFAHRFQQTVTGTGTSSSSSSSSLAVDESTVSDITSTQNGDVSPSFSILFAGSISAFSKIRVSDNTIRGLNVPTTQGRVRASLVYFVAAVEGIAGDTDDEVTTFRNVLDDMNLTSTSNSVSISVITFGAGFTKFNTVSLSGSEITNTVLNAPGSNIEVNGIYFASATTGIDDNSSLSVNSTLLQNVSGFGSTAVELRGTSFGASLSSFNNIEFQNTTLSRLSLESGANNILTHGIYINSAATGTANSDASFIIHRCHVSEINSTAKQKSEVFCFIAQNTLTDFPVVNASDISLIDIFSQTQTDRAFVTGFVLVNTLDAPETLAIENIRIQDIIMETASQDAAIRGVWFQKQVSSLSIRISNLSLYNVTAFSSAAAIRVLGIHSNNKITDAAGDGGSSSSSSPSFVVHGCSVELVNVTTPTSAKDNKIACYRSTAQGITGFVSVNFSDFSVANTFQKAKNEPELISAISIEVPLAAHQHPSANGGVTSFTVDGCSMDRITIDKSDTTNVSPVYVTCFRIEDQLSNWSSITFRNFIVKNCNFDTSILPFGFLDVIRLSPTAEIKPRISSSSSDGSTTTFSVTNISLQSVSFKSRTRAWLIHGIRFRSKLVGYETVSFDDFSFDDLQAVSTSNNVIMEAVCFDTSSTEGANTFNSSLTVSNIRMTNLNVESLWDTTNASAVIHGLKLTATSGFSRVVFSDFTILDVAAQSHNNVLVGAVECDGVVDGAIVIKDESTSNNSNANFEFKECLVKHITVNSTTAATKNPDAMNTVSCLRMSDDLVNFTTIAISNTKVEAVSQLSSNEASPSVIVNLFEGSVSSTKSSSNSSSSFSVSDNGCSLINATIETNSSNVTAACFYFEKNVSGFNNINIARSVVTDLDLTSSFGSVSAHSICFEGSLEGSSEMTNSSFIVSTAQLKNVNASAAAAASNSSFMMMASSLEFYRSVSDFATMHFSSLLLLGIDVKEAAQQQIAVARLIGFHHDNDDHQSSSTSIPSFSSSSSASTTLPTVMIRDSTVDLKHASTAASSSNSSQHCLFSSCSLLWLEEGTALAGGNWSFINTSISSLSTPLIRAASTTLTSPAFHSNTRVMLENNFMLLGSDNNNNNNNGGVVSRNPFSLDSSTFYFACNRWSNSVNERFRNATGDDTSNPTVTFNCVSYTKSSSKSLSIKEEENVTMTRTKTPTVSLVPPPPPLSNTTSSTTSTTTIPNMTTTTTTTTMPNRTRTTSRTKEETVYEKLPSQAPTTTFPGSTLVSSKNYAPIDQDLTTFPSFTPPQNLPSSGLRFQDVSGKTNMDDIINIVERITSETPSSTVTLRTPDRNLGTFVVRLVNLPLAVKYIIDSTSISFTSSNLTELAQALKNGYAFSVSPEAEARNLTAGQYVEFTGRDSGTQEGKTSIVLNLIQLNDGPQPMYPLAMNATFNVSRGRNFILDLNYTFIHNQQLPMKIAAQLADQYSLPRLVRLVCESSGKCSFRGVIDDENPLHIQLQASDDFFIRVSFITVVPVVVPIRPNEEIELLPLLLRPGREFLYPIPSSLFVSSTDIVYTSVRLATGFPMPITIAFDPPNLLRGVYHKEGILQLQVRASDLFFDAARNLTLNFTNVRPFCRNDFTTLVSPGLNVSTPNIVPVAALQEFSRTIEFSQVCADNDNDPLRFDVNTFGLPLWLRFLVQPGGATTLPQTLRLTGTPPVSVENSIVFVNVTVTDLYASLILSIPLRVVKNSPPRLIRPLPNYTLNPGDVETFSIDLSLHFEDSNNDPLIVTATVVTEYAQTWLQTTVNTQNFLYLTCRPPEEEPLQADNAKDSDERVLVRVEDPFGNFTETTINVYVRLTLWQKLRSAVYILAALFSAFLSVVSTILLYHHVVNFFRAGSTQIKCPLNARNRVWKIPETASRVEIKLRAEDIFMALRNFSRHFSIWMYDELTLRGFPHDDPPNWCVKIDHGLKLGNIEKEPGTTTNQVKQHPVYDQCFVRIYNRRGIIICQFPMNYHEVTAGWDFELVAAEEKFEKQQQEKKKRRNNDDFSELSFDLDDDDDDDHQSRISNNNNNNNTATDHSEKEKWSDLDTKMISIDLQLDQSEEEMKTMKTENKTLKNEVSTLKDLVQSLLSGKTLSANGGGAVVGVMRTEASTTNVSDFSPTLNEDEQYQPPEEFDLGIDDEYDNNGKQEEEEEDIIVTRSSSPSRPTAISEVEQTHNSHNGKQLLDFSGEEKAYKPPDAYDRDLEDLLYADVAAKTKRLKEERRKPTTFNPIKEKLEKADVEAPL